MTEVMREHLESVRYGGRRDNQIMGADRSPVRLEFNRKLRMNPRHVKIERKYRKLTQHNFDEFEPFLLLTRATGTVVTNQ